MNPQRITSQCLALAPEIPGYQIAAYMLELLEKLRSDGTRLQITLDTEDLGTYDCPIPANIITAFEVYVDTVKIPQTLNVEDVVVSDRSASKKCLIQDKIYFNFALPDSCNVLVDGLYYDDTITIETIGDKWTIGFIYYILSRYYSAVDANQSNYYREMYDMQVARISQRRMAAPMVSIGDDL